MYPPVNSQFDPENHQCLMETSLPTPMTARVYVNLPEGFIFQLMNGSRTNNQWLKSAVFTYTKFLTDRIWTNYFNIEYFSQIESFSIPSGELT